MKTYQVIVSYTYIAFVDAENEKDATETAIIDAVEMAPYNFNNFEIKGINCFGEKEDED